MEFVFGAGNGAHLDPVLVAQPSTAAGSGSVSLPGPTSRWIRAARRRSNPQARTPALRCCRVMVRTVSSCAFHRRAQLDPTAAPNRKTGAPAGSRLSRFLVQTGFAGFNCVPSRLPAGAPAELSSRAGHLTGRSAMPPFVPRGGTD